MSVQETPTKGLTGKINNLDMSTMQGKSLSDKLAGEAEAKDVAQNDHTIHKDPYISRRCQLMLNTKSF